MMYNSSSIILNKLRGSILKKIKEHFIVISVLLLASFIFVGPYLIKDLPFVYGGDLQPSWYAFYTEMQNLISISAIIQHFRLPFYSWSMFLGNNFWSSKAFYGLSDIFNYITLYLPVHFYTAFVIQTVLKIILSGYTFFLLAKNWKEDFKANLLVAIAYALSSWMIYFIGQTSFVSFYALFPLYILGIDQYYKKSNPILFIISTTLLLFTNFYLSFSMIIFTVLYTYYRYFLLHYNLKGFYKETSLLILYAIIAVSITAVIIYPTALYMFGNDRVGEIKYFLIFDQIRIYLHQLVSAFVPSELIIYQDNPFETGAHNTREILLYSGSVSALLITQFLSDKNKQYEKATLILFSILIIIFFLPIGDSMMQGFSQASFRWLYLFIFVNLMIAHRYLSDLSLISIKTLKITLVSIVSLLIIVYLISVTLDTGITHLLDYPRTSGAFVLSIIGLIFAYLIFNKFRKNLLLLLIILTFTELSYAGYLNLVSRRMNPDRTWLFEERVTEMLQSYPNELNDFLDSLEPSNPFEYYRVFVPQESVYWSYSHNMAVHYQLQGLMTYDSIYAPSFNDLKTITDEVKAFSSDWLFDIRNADLVNFLNTKYAIVVNESELPHSDFTLIVDGYREAFKIYRNELYRPLGTIYTDIIDYDTYKSFYQNDLSLLESTLIVHVDDLSSINKLIGTSNNLSWNAINHYDNHLDGSFVTETNGFMVLTLPYDAGWKIRINGETVKSYQVNGGFIGIPVVQGENILEMDFVPIGFKTGAIVSVLGLLSFIVVLLKQFYKKN